MLYLSVGEPRVPAETLPTPEGHAVDVDADGNVIGMVLVSVRLLLDRDAQLKITWPEGHLGREQLAPGPGVSRLVGALQLAKSSSSRGRKNRHVRPSRRAGKHALARQFVDGRGRHPEQLCNLSSRHHLIAV